MSAATVVILAAGEGTRMNSSVPKCCHPICGRPLVLWPILAARAAGAGKVVVVDNSRRPLANYLPSDVVSVVQEHQRGTGDAVRAASSELDLDQPVVVLPGDVPLVDSATITALLEHHARTGASATVATMELDDPSGYGRIVRAPGGAVERIVETKVVADATAEELALREVNSGLFVFDPSSLKAALGELRSDNAQQEFYLPDVVALLGANGQQVSAFELSDPNIALGINDRVDLAEVRGIAQAAIHRRHQQAGVTITEPASTIIDVEVAIGPDTIVEPSSSVCGDTTIGARSVVGPLTTVIDAWLGDDVHVVHSYVNGAHLDQGVTVGPFAYLRPGTTMEIGAKAGTFVEIKNSVVGPSAKVPHLSYIGDSDIGEGANIGAGTLTANYDGKRKHRTVIGKRARIGVDTALVAPVNVGDDAYTGAGSVVVEDIPAKALAVARAKQHTIEGYADRKSTSSSD